MDKMEKAGPVPLNALKLNHRTIPVKKFPIRPTLFVLIFNSSAALFDRHGRHARPSPRAPSKTILFAVSRATNIRT
jgi:hypothetical protein